VGIVGECDIVEDREHYYGYEIVAYGLLVILQFSNETADYRLLFESVVRYEDSRLLELV
jgi:hypothetical protein